MALTQADLDSIEEAIATGVRVVRYSNGKEVRYHSLDDLLKARRLTRKLLGVDNGKPQRKVMGTNKGVVEPRSYDRHCREW